MASKNPSWTISVRSCWWSQGLEELNSDGFDVDLCGCTIFILWFDLNLDDFYKLCVCVFCFAIQTFSTIWGDLQETSIFDGKPRFQHVSTGFFFSQPPSVYHRFGWFSHVKNPHRWWVDWNFWGPRLLMPIWRSGCQVDVNIPTLCLGHPWLSRKRAITTSANDRKP